MRIRDMGCHSHHQRRTDHADHELHVGRRWRHAAASATKETSQKWLHPHVHCPDTVAAAVSVGMTWWWWRLVVEVRTGTSNTVCIGRPPNVGSSQPTYQWWTVISRGRKMLADLVTCVNNDGEWYHWFWKIQKKSIELCCFGFIMDRALITISFHFCVNLAHTTTPKIPNMF
jgi:hypothetical protein